MVMRIVDGVVHFVLGIGFMMEEMWMTGFRVLVEGIQSLLLVGSSYDVTDPIVTVFRAKRSHDDEHGKGR